MPPCTQIVGIHLKILTVYDYITVDYFITHSKIASEPSYLQRIETKRCKSFKILHARESINML